MSELVRQVREGSWEVGGRDEGSGEGNIVESRESKREVERQ